MSTVEHYRGERAYWMVRARQRKQQGNRQAMLYAINAAISCHQRLMQILGKQRG